MRLLRPDESDKLDLESSQKVVVLFILVGTGLLSQKTSTLSVDSTLFNLIKQRVQFNKQIRLLNLGTPS